jgi:hypothetical protein
MSAVIRPPVLVFALALTALAPAADRKVDKDLPPLKARVELAPPPRPVVVGVQFTHIGGRRVPVGSLLVTDRLKESDLKPHIVRYKHADRSDELIAVKRVDKEYLRTVGRLLDQVKGDTKTPGSSVVRVVLIWGDDHREYYLTPEDASRVYRTAIKATKDEDLVELLEYHLKLFDR